MDLLGEVSENVRGVDQWDSLLDISKWKEVRSIDDLNNIVKTKNDLVILLQLYRFMFGVNDKQSMNIDFLRNLE